MARKSEEEELAEAEAEKEVAEVATEEAVVAIEAVEVKVKKPELIDQELKEEKEKELNREKAQKKDSEEEEEVAQEEAEVEADPLLKVEKVMKESFMMSEKKELISKEKVNISRVRETKSGTHTTENQALEEVENSPRVATEEATGETLKKLLN